MYRYIRIHACIHAYIQRYRHTHTYIHACMHAYIHTYILTYMHACMHTCIHTYMHTYIHTYIANHQKPMSDTLCHAEHYVQGSSYVNIYIYMQLNYASDFILTSLECCLVRASSRNGPTFQVFFGLVL